MAGTEQIVRVLALASSLAKTAQGLTLRAFAEQHGYSLRSVYRDVEALEAAGYPIVKDADRYALAGDWEPPCQADISRDEALALLLARQLFGSLEGIGFGNALESLWTKLGTSTLIRPTFSVRPLCAIDYGSHEATISLLKEAISNHRVARITYQRPDLSEPTERLVESGELYLDPGLEQLSLIAWCRLRQDVRSFAVHRINCVTLTDEHFQPRPEASSANKFKSAFRTWSGDTIQKVRLKFAPRVAREIEERKWHSSQQLFRDARNHLHLQLEISEPRELKRWLLGYGPDVEVLEPSWLAQLVEERHRAALADFQS